MTTDYLDAVLDSLRRHGVVRFKSDEMDVTFGGQVPAATRPGQAAPQEPDVSAERPLGDHGCECGHSIEIEHDWPLCKLGCPVETCLKTKPPT